MAGFEDLIRKALAQQNATDPAARQKIYTSSRQALERMLGQNPNMAEAQIIAQRQRLEGAIGAIEAEFAPVQSTVTPQPAPSVSAAPAPKSPPAAPAPPDTPQASPVPAAAPQVAAAPKPAETPQRAPTPKPVAAPPPMPRLREEPAAPKAAPTPEPVTAKPADSVRLDTGDRAAPLAPERPLEDYTAQYRDELTTKRKPYAKLFLWTIILVGLGVAIWWAITFGAALLKQQIDGSVPNPSPTIESGSFVPGGGEGWLNVFLPAEDSQNVDTEGRGTADLFQDANSTFLRLASNAGSTANTIRIKMPRGIMQNIRGKVATFELTMKGPEADGHQFAVFCEFGPQGECGRKRFRIRNKVEAFVFDVLVNDAALPSSQDAYLVINTDLSSTGKSVDLLAVRVRTGD